MINGTYAVERVLEESVCRTSTKYRFTEIGVYKIHSNALMPNIPFGEAESSPQSIDGSIFLNDDETKIEVATQITTQNFLTTRYIGYAPLTYYTTSSYSELGTEFILICRDGIPTERYRSFGTERAVHGFSRGSIDMYKFPGGGEMA